MATVNQCENVISHLKVNSNFEKWKTIFEIKEGNCILGDYTKWLTCYHSRIGIFFIKIKSILKFFWKET